MWRKNIGCCSKYSELVKIRTNNWFRGYSFVPMRSPRISIFYRRSCPRLEAVSVRTADEIVHSDCGVPLLSISIMQMEISRRVLI